MREKLICNGLHYKNILLEYFIFSNESYFFFLKVFNSLPNQEMITCYFHSLMTWGFEFALSNFGPFLISVESSLCLLCNDTLTN